MSDHNWTKLDLNKKKKPQKIVKHMETEQHTAERQVGDKRNKGRNKKAPRI
jgi:hypothetical protein